MIIGNSGADVDVLYSTVATSVSVFFGILLEAAIVTRILIHLH